MHCQLCEASENRKLKLLYTSKILSILSWTSKSPGSYTSGIGKKRGRKTAGIKSWDSLVSLRTSTCPFGGGILCSTFAGPIVFAHGTNPKITSFSGVGFTALTSKCWLIGIILHNTLAYKTSTNRISRTGSCSACSSWCDLYRHNGISNLKDIDWNVGTRRCQGCFQCLTQWSRGLLRATDPTLLGLKVGGLLCQGPVLIWFW